MIYFYPSYPISPFFSSASALINESASSIAKKPTKFLRNERKILWQMSNCTFLQEMSANATKQFAELDRMVDGHLSGLSRCQTCLVTINGIRGIHVCPESMSMKAGYINKSSTCDKAKHIRGNLRSNLKHFPYNSFSHPSRLLCVNILMLRLLFLDLCTQ